MMPRKRQISDIFSALDHMHAALISVHVVLLCPWSFGLALGDHQADLAKVAHARSKVQDDIRPRPPRRETPASVSRRRGHDLQITPLHRLDAIVEDRFQRAEQRGDYVRLLGLQPASSAGLSCLSRASTSGACRRILVEELGLRNQ
jgi:hypothetical protein